MISNLFYRLRALFRRNSMEAELDAELRAHIEQQAEKYVQAGMCPEEAARRARLEFGGIEQVKEECRDSWGIRFIGELAQDLRFGLRQLRRNPGFTTVAVLTLALGIGASTVIFSLFDAVFLRPLPVRHSGELVRFVQHTKIGDRSYFPLAYIRALRDRSKSYDFVFGELGENYHFALTEPAPAEAVTLRAVTPNFFEALGVPALYGHALMPAAAAEESGTPPAVLSYNFWKRRFAGDPEAVKGQIIVVNRQHFEVVGVMPSRFGGLSLDTAPDLWIPMRAYPALWSGNAKTSRNLDTLEFDLTARLKPGVKRESAQAESRAIWRPVMKDYYEHVLKLASPVVSAELRHPVWLEPLGHGLSAVRNQFGDAFKLLMASVSILFLIVCANTAGLLLARNAARQQEIAIRLAVGATRLRVARQMLTESLLLASIGAVGGLFIARAAMPLAAQQIPPIRDLMGWPMAVLLKASINPSVFLFSLGLTVLATLLFGLASAMAHFRANLEDALRGSRFSAPLRGRQALIVIQTALCVALLIAAGLFVRTWRELADTHPGFNTSRVVTFTEDLTDQHVPPELLNTAIERVREMPGVVSAAASQIGVMRGHGMVAGLAPAGQRITSAEWLNADTNSVSPGYFSTMDMRILAGRGFAPSDESDNEENGPVNVIVNQALARKFFPDTDPIGRLIGMGRVGEVARAEEQIIGVVNDAKCRSLREPIRPTIYGPLIDLRHAKSFVLYVRTRMPSETMVVPVQKLLASIDPSLPVGFADTLSEEVRSSISGDRETAVLASLFGIAAALLVCLGIYGLLAYSVAQRQREIGIRMALGAERRDVLRMVVGQGLKLALIGVVIGIAGALALTRFLSSMLYGVKPTDPLTFIGVSLILIAVALLACYIPARRAAKVDPMVALRYE
jgi:putative ABC transport system permease protein